MHGHLISTASIAVVSSARVVDAAEAGDLTTALMQLGIGGVLVAFGAAIYRRFETRADKAQAKFEMELKALNEKHDEDIRSLTVRFEDRLDKAFAEHQATRDLYIQALTKDIR